MSIETLGDAWLAGWRVKARCAAGGRAGLKSIRECHREYEIDMQSLVWTRGAAMPLGDLSSRLRCPTCRSLKVSVAFVPPPVTDINSAPRSAPAPREDMAMLPHRVELVGKHGSVDRIVATSTDLDIADAAYAIAVRRISLGEGCSLVLRHHGRAIRVHPPQPAEKVDVASPEQANAEFTARRVGLPKGRRRAFK